MPETKELDEETHARTVKLGKAGDARMAKDDRGAPSFRAALDPVPEPCEEWCASPWLLAAPGDAHQLDGRHEKERRSASTQSSINDFP